MKKKIAVIILNWNGLKLLKEFLPLASKYTISEDADLFVADNGSTDGSLDWIKENHPEVNIIDLKKNYGFAEGYNRAIEATDYEYSLLLNSDVEVTPDWCIPLLEFMEKNENVAAVQPKIKSYHDRESFEYAGAAGGYLDRLGYPYCRGRLFDSIEKDEGQYDGKPEPVVWASGAALMVRTKDYIETGGLDPLFFAHMEEIDLCCRFQAEGKDVFCVPDSEVYHVGGASLEQGNPRKTYLNFRNNLLLLHKNTPSGKGDRRLFMRRLTDTLAFFMFVAKLDWKNAGAILDAHKDFRKMKKQYPNRPEKDFLSHLPGSRRFIVMERYLLRRKR